MKGFKNVEFVNAQSRTIRNKFAILECGKFWAVSTVVKLLNINEIDAEFIIREFLTCPQAVKESKSLKINFI